MNNLFWKILQYYKPHPISFKHNTCVEQCRLIVNMCYGAEKQVSFIYIVPCKSCCYKMKLLAETLCNGTEKEVSAGNIALQFSNKNVNSTP